MHFLSVRGMVSRGLLIVKDSIHISTFLFFGGRNCPRVLVNFEDLGSQGLAAIDG